MPRFVSIRNALAIVTMAVAALCGGGKVVAAQKGSLSVVELRAGAATRPDTRKRSAAGVEVALEASVVVRDSAGEPATAGADNAPVSGINFSYRGGSVAAPRRVSSHQTRRCIVCVRPPTRAPPQQFEIDLTVPTNRA